MGILIKKTGRGGDDNIVYFISKTNNNKEAEEIVKRQNEAYKMMGLNTRVVLWNENERGGFDPKFMDRTDNVQVYGDSKTVGPYMRGMFPDDTRFNGYEADGNLGYSEPISKRYNTAGRWTTINRDNILSQIHDINKHRGKYGADKITLLDFAPYVGLHESGHAFTSYTRSDDGHYGSGVMENPTSKYLSIKLGKLPVSEYFKEKPGSLFIQRNIEQRQYGDVGRRAIDNYDYNKSVYEYNASIGDKGTLVPMYTNNEASSTYVERPVLLKKQKEQWRDRSWTSGQAPDSGASVLDLIKQK